METDQEGMIQIAKQHVPLTHDMILFVSLQYHLLVQHFDGVNGVLLLVTSRVDFAKTALADGAQEFKITWLDRPLLRWAQIDFRTRARGDCGDRFLWLILILQTVFGVLLQMEKVPNFRAAKTNTNIQIEFHLLQESQSLTV